MKKIIAQLIALVTGNLSNLTTTEKGTIIGAINEVNGKSAGSSSISNVPQSIQTKVLAQNYDGTNYKVDGNVLAKLIAGNNFSPNDLSTLVGWWDFTDQPTITLNSGNISAITDKSSAGNNLVQATSGNQPPYVTYGGQNDFGYANFSSSSHALAKASFVYSQPYTVFMVFNINPYGGQLLNFQDSGNGVACNTYTSGDYVAKALGPCAKGAYQRPNFNFAGNCLIVGWTYDYMSTDKTFNGFIQHTANLGIENPGNAATVLMQIGGGSLMQMYEVLFFNGRLKPSDLLKVDNYLHAKYEVPEKNLFFAFGDSVTAGFNSSNILAGYVQRASKYKGVDPVIIAVSGKSLNDHMRVLYTQYLRSVPKNSYIGIAYGSNDYAVINSSWNTSLRTIIQNLLSAGFTPAKILLITPPYSSTRASQLAIQQGYFATAATDFGVSYVDCITPTLAAGGDSLLSDGTHPTDAGHEVMAQAVLAKM